LRLARRLQLLVVGTVVEPILVPRLLGVGALAVAIAAASAAAPATASSASAATFLALIIAWRARPIRYAGLLADPGGLGRRRGGGLDFSPRRLGLGRVRAAHLGFSDRLGLRRAGARFLAAIAAAAAAAAARAPAFALLLRLRSKVGPFLLLDAVALKAPI